MHKVAASMAEAEEGSHRRNSMDIKYPRDHGILNDCVDLAFNYGRSARLYSTVARVLVCSYAPFSFVSMMLRSHSLIQQVPEQLIPQM